MNSRTLYFVHRWLGLVVALQLLAWSLGGLTFSLLDIDDVHGDLDRVEAKPPPLPTAGIVPVERALADVDDAVRASLVQRRSRLVWQIDKRDGAPLLVDAVTAERLSLVDAEEAKRIALADTKGARGVVEATLFESAPPTEYRKKPLPAWRVTLEHDKEIHVYVHALTGEVTARRNAKWRVFDFFWMLHVMDYSEREDFQHPLITGFALLAVLASTSGLVLWIVRFRRFTRRAT